MPVLVRRGKRLELIDSSTRVTVGDRVAFAFDSDRRQTVHAWLAAEGWTDAVHAPERGA